MSYNLYILIVLCMYMAKKEKPEPEFDVEEVEEAFDNI